MVLKIGGSLYHSPYLKEWLSTFSKLEIGLVIVPGGGPFADQVRTASRDWDLPESCAHDMAVLGMQQYAHMLVGLTDNIRLVETLQELIDAIANQHVVVWAPYLEVTRATDLKKNWQTTSDSIAIWLAAKINARNLLLIKSAKVAEINLTFTSIGELLPTCVMVPS